MTCKEFDKILVDYFEGSLSADQKEKVNQHLKQCQNCTAVFNQYEKLVSRLHRMPAATCPDRVIDKVFNSFSTIQQEKAKLSSRFRFLLRGFSWKISFAAAVAVIIISLILFYPKEPKINSSETLYSTQEIEQAKKDVELALGYFHLYAKKTGFILENQILSKPIAKPIKSTMEKAFKPLLTGGKI